MKGKIMNEHKIKVGDIVKITDVSYATTVTHTGLYELCYNNTSENRYDVLYKVVEVGCTFPQREGQKDTEDVKWQNNTVIISNEGTVFFIQDDQLEKINAVTIMLKSRPVYVEKHVFANLVTGLKNYFDV